ncbi:MAG: acetyl-coenzyme A synthetase, partial [Planctomycetota bacterium]
MADGAIDSVLVENRVFPPPPDFAAEAHVKSLAEYEALHERALRDPEGFWGEVAREFDWFEPFTRVLEWNPPDARWFVGGRTNLCHNCVDRQVAAGLGERPAIHWEGEPVDEQGKPREVRTLTYNDLLRETSRLANALKSLGVKKGDIVTLYMPMVPELAVAMLACARIGAAHSVVFGGFSASAIADRLLDASSRVVLTADGGWRRGGVVPLKANVDEACALVKERKGRV